MIEKNVSVKVLISFPNLCTQDMQMACNNCTTIERQLTAGLQPTLMGSINLASRACASALIYGREGRPPQGLPDSAALCSQRSPDWPPFRPAHIRHRPGAESSRTRVREQPESVMQLLHYCAIAGGPLHGL